MTLLKLTDGGFIAAQTARTMTNVAGDKNTKAKYQHIPMFHRAFFNSIIDKTPTYALFIQHYISLAC